MSVGSRAPWGSYAKAFAATVLWGSSFVAVRIALEKTAPAGVVWIRNGLAAAALYALLAWRGERLLPERADRARCLLLGTILGVHLLAQSFALTLTTAMRAGWIVAFMPASIAMAAKVFQGRGLRPIAWIGIGIAIAGVLILTSMRPSDLAGAAPGDIVMLGTTLTWTAYVLLAEAPSRRSGGLRVAAAAIAVATVPNLAAAACSGTWRGSPDPGVLAALAFLGLGASAAAMAFFNQAIVELGPARSSAFQYLQPLVTVVASMLVRDESMSASQWIGGPLVLAGVALIQRGRQQGGSAPGEPARAERGPDRSSPSPSAGSVEPD
jgi:drug/metabolite transporter (DMT)-like permease